MKKLLVLLAVLVLISILITACGGGTTTTPSATSPAVTSQSPTVPASTTTATTKPTATTSSPASSPASTSPTTSKPAAGPQYGGTLRYVGASGPGAPIGAPWLSNGGSTFGIQFAIEFLIKGNADATLSPGLATSWDVASDPTNPSVTLHLAKGVKFQDGSDFNAAAVKWNMDKAMSPGSTLIGSTTNWKSIDVVDDYTIRFNLKTFQNTAVNVFATSAGFIISPTAYQKNGADWINFNMVGTGAFMQSDFQRDVHLNLTRYPNYREQGKPYLDGIAYIFVPDALTSEALFKAGGADILQSPSDLITSKFRALGNTIISSKVSGNTNLWPDSANPDSAWSNVKVRQAAEYAIDKESLAKTFGYGNWVTAYQSNASVSPAFDPNLTPRKYDVAKAKQLMAEAGYPNGFKTTIYLSAVAPALQDVAVAIQSMWKTVGINADLQIPQAAAWSAMLTGNTWKGVLFGPGSGAANPLTGWNLTYSPGSAWFQSVKRPADIGDLFKAAMAAPKLDPALAQKVEDSIFNDDTVIPLWFSPTNWIVGDNVMDTGLGTRDLFAWFEPQNAWFKK
jgi:peptide/nickel transport system substrate-binding protein